MRDLLTDCGQMGNKIGTEMLLYEVDVEKNVVEPLSQVENEAANIAKARRNLNKLILDMDSARTRSTTSPFTLLFLGITLESSY